MSFSSYPNLPNGTIGLRSALAIALLCLQVFSQSPAVESPVTVRPGEPLELKLVGGARKVISVDCGPDQFNSLTIEQHGIDVVTRLLDEQDKVVAEYDADPRISGEEIVEFVGGSDGVCRFSVEPRQRGAREGKVLIRAASARPATDKDRSLDEARRSLTEVVKLWRAAKYQEALPLAERVLAIRSRELGPDHPDVGMAIFSIANIYSDIPDFKKSEVSYLKALEIRSKALGTDHFSLASIYNNLGVLYKDAGFYTKADEMYQKALGIRERVLEPDHVLIASTMNNVAGVARVRGDEARALSLYRRVLEMREKALGPDHPDVATALNNVTSPDLEISIAEPAYLRVLAIREKALPPDHPEIAQTWFNLSIVYSLAGQIEKAQNAGDRSLTIFQRSLGVEHPNTLLALNQSAVIATSKGDLVRAEELFKRTISLREKVQGMYHPELANSLAGLANLYAIIGDMEKAIAAQTRANEIVEYNTSLNLMAGSEREKLRYMRMLNNFSDRTLTLSFSDAKRSKAATELALSSVLQRKGRVLDVMSESISTLRRRLDPNGLALLDELTETNTKLSAIILSGTVEAGAAEYQKQTAQLEARRDQLERRLSSQAFAHFEKRGESLISQVRSSLPENTVLVEFATYVPVERTALPYSPNSVRQKTLDRERYVAFVVRNSGDIQSVDLGDARSIDLAVSEFRNALRTPGRNNWEDLGKQLREKLMKPVLSQVAGSDLLLFSPDGQLNLIPFEALVASNGKFLIEEHPIVYLTSGRDLMRHGSSAPKNTAPVIVAQPDFGIGESFAAGASRSTGRASQRRSITSADSLRDTYFGPLNGTAQEARAIQSLFPDSVAFTGAKATETIVKQVAGPRILHLATHGFFVNGLGEPKDPESDPYSLRYPLLRSGLAFAGANLRKGEKDDGILTALEASGLDLWGTELVVLSACDTGLGEIRNGEGVYGLRRSFLLAGAESLVMSLWPVSDQVTRELMTGYYQNLKKGLGRGEALRQVRLQMIRRPNRRHPFYWASFIQSGEWANLEGRR